MGSGPREELRQELEVSQRKRPRLRVINKGSCFVSSWKLWKKDTMARKKASTPTSRSRGDDDDGDASSELHSNRERKKEKKRCGSILKTLLLKKERERQSPVSRKEIMACIPVSSKQTVDTR